MTFFLAAHRTSIGIALQPDAVTVQFNVIAEAEGGGQSVLLLSGNAHLADCDLSLTVMDGQPMLGMGSNVLPLNDLDTMRQVGEYLGLPMPAINPARCAAQQERLA